MTPSNSRARVAGFLMLVAAFTANAQASTAEIQAKLNRYAHNLNEIVVRLDVSKQAIGALSRDASILRVESFETHPEFAKVVVREKSDLAETIERLNRTPGVLYAEPNYIFRTQARIPNDSMFNRLWGLQNTGQADAAGQVGLAGADIRAAEAWSMFRGSNQITVAVIDTGIDYNHPDLAANIYRNPGESGGGRETNGIDDDNDGFVDNVMGWNFAGVSTNNPMDDQAHGTHCAGTIGASGNNGIGVVGVAWNVKLMPIKFLSSSGSGTLADAVKSIQYATRMGVQIMSNSWGGGPYTQALFDAIKDARDRGILFVAAAGNDSENGDAFAHYPSAYDLSNVLAVAATDNQDKLATFSNYGKRTVDIAAPGVKIWSTTPNNNYAAYNGTSMATPHVSGAAALLWGYLGNTNFLEVKNRIINSRDPKPQLSRKIASGGRLNLYNALIGYYAPSLEPAESEWVDGPAISPIETPHPYGNNENSEWVFTGPANARMLRFRIAQADLEQDWDFLKIYNPDGTEADEITGLVSSPTYTWFVNGNSARFRFTSDSSVTRWGFRVEGYQYIPQ